ncbi:MAG: PEP-CTERM sorting domain-containing protein [Armatimonadetes bacterium]|nr:PEP-CTERM sorting domain-containing protein [Armatimonadota bacterium]
MKSILSIALVCVACLSSATVLTFSDLGKPDGSGGSTALVNYDAIDQGYGDNVTGSGGFPSGSYLMGNGWTPNVTASYDTVDGTGASVENWVEYWDTGYGDLVDVAYAGISGYYARITLTPDSGNTVTINSFDLAGWPTSDLTADAIHILNASGTEVWSASSMNVEGNAGHTSFSPGISSSGALTIEWGTNWNIGIDNVNFDQGLVPEPASLAVLGLGTLAMIRRKRNR